MIPRNKLLVMITQRYTTNSYSLEHTSINFLCGQLLVCIDINWLNAQKIIHNHSKKYHTLPLYSMQKPSITSVSYKTHEHLFPQDHSYWTCSWICGFVQYLYGNVSFLSSILLWRMLKWNVSWCFVNQPAD